MNKITKNLKGKVKLALPVLLIVGLLLIVLLGSFSKSEGEAYSLIVFYNGTSIPSGWTCISCNVGDPFYQKFIMINSTYNVSGGSNTHNHLGDFNSAIMPTLSQSVTIAGLSTGTSGTHTHTSSLTVSSGNLSPEYYSLKVIRYNNGIPTTLPTNTILLYNGSSLPTGWNLFSTAEGDYIMGENSFSSGGSSTHTHSVSGSITAGTPTAWIDDTSSNYFSLTGHSHTVSSQSMASSVNTPSYASFKLIHTTAVSTIPGGAIGLFNSTPATGWVVLGTDYNGRLIKMNSTELALGGSTTHSHAAINISSDQAPSYLLENVWLGISSVSYAMHQHRHNITVSTTSYSAFPQYNSLIAATFVSDTPKIQFVLPTPSNGTIQAEDYVPINITAQTNISLSNISQVILDWDGSNQTLYPHLPPLCSLVGDTMTCFINQTSLADDTYCYQAYVINTFGQTNATERRCVTTGWNDVVMYLYQPQNGVGTVDPDIDFICGAVSFAPMDNVTLFVWNSTNDLVYNATASGGFSYYLNLSDTYTLPDYGLYHWNCLGYDVNGNFSWYGSNYTILYQNSFVMVINETYNPETLESGNEPYYITLYRYNASTEITPEFYWDGDLDNNTIYSSQNGNYITFRVTRPLDFISPNSEDHSFYWSFWYYQGGIPENLNSTNHTQTIYRMILQNNNSGGAVPTLQTQCIDEMTLTEINCSITDIIDTWPSTSYGEENRQRSFYFSFNNNNSNYTLYRLPDGVADFHTDAEFIASATGYQQRTTTYSNYILNNTQRNQTIYLLDTNSGIYVSFLVVNQMYTPLTDVNIKVEKRILGIWVPIMNGATDESGIWTGFLDPTNMHRFTFNKTGYAIKVLSIYPTQSSYTVILLTEGQGSGTLPNNYMDGINITVSPTDMALTPGEDYNFTMNITSQYWELDSYGFNLVDENHNVLASTSDYQPNGSCVNVIYSCTNQTYVHMDYYFSVNNSNANFTKSWWVKTEYVGNYSIMYLVNDVRALVGTSGLNYFTLLLIAFAITLMLTAALAYVTGLYSPMALMGLITAFTWFWYWLNIIPHDINGLNGAGVIVPVLITALFIGYAVYENVR